MDCRTGQIVEMDQQKTLELVENNEIKHFVPLDTGLEKELRPLSKKKRKNRMRNKSCVCGSKKKFKNCCWGQYA